MATVPPADSEHARDANRQIWTGRAGSRGRYHDKLVVHLGALTEAIVEAGRIEPGMQVLDIAFGTGDPAFRLAKIVGSEGHVTATDLAPEMLEVAEDGARRAQLSNMTFQQADAEALPFPDHAFDAVTCRLGIMFFGDPIQGLREIRRVLKAGGHAAFVAWGPFERSERVASTNGVLAKYVYGGSALSPTNASRFAEPGTLKSTLRSAGFQDAWEEARVGPTPWPGSAEDCWEFSRDAAARHLERIPTERREEAVAEVLATLRKYDNGSQLNLSAAFVVGGGTA